MLVFSRNMQIDIILIINLVLFLRYLPISHSQDNEEKNWLDACDIHRMKKGGFGGESAGPRTPKTPSGPSRPPYKCPGAVPFRPSASKDELTDAVKQKLLIDAFERGSYVEKEDWTKDARGFISDFYGDNDDDDYDYDYYPSNEMEQ
ncbi:uncharacterized protein LOC123315431 [Coccinella septempunctata]|uniref:uncharacterized protein LOC123315431 n=1 Tax=Coccinella septempunctata TaxID=41139 RepID=UPI001D081E48|nr:uncharacterized protein LOC123315431 [Coccinella septempunctata]